MNLPSHSHTLWVLNHQRAHLEIGTWPARPAASPAAQSAYQSYVSAGHVLSVVSLWGHQINLGRKSAEVTPVPYSGPILGPMTSERFRLESQLTKLHAANLALFKKRTVRDTRPVREQVFDFCTTFNVRVRGIENWRPLAPGTYTHQVLPLGPLRIGITDGVVAHLATPRLVSGPLRFSGLETLTVWDTVLVQLQNLSFLADRSESGEVTDSADSIDQPDKPAKPTKPTKKFNPFDYL